MKRTIIPLLLSLVTSVCATASTYYVWPGGRGLKTGLSWADASDDLQAMINTASGGDQVWVAKGTYKPERHADNTSIVDPGNRANAFVLKKDVCIYGGFTGVETLLNARDSISRATILSGDFSGNDVVAGTGAALSFSGNGENAYHVVIAAGDMGTVVLDGCKVTGGNANAAGSYVVNGRTIRSNSGAGIYGDGAKLTINNCSILQNAAIFNGGGINSINDAAQHMQHCVISNNWADSSGGGIATYMAAAPVLSACAVTGNFAGYLGGGLFGFEADSSAAHTDCIISNNSAAYGGGIYNFYGGNALVHCSITGNTATNQGGGIYNFYAPRHVHRNCEITNNSAFSGGGIYSFASMDPNGDVYSLCNISGNTATGDGGGIYGEWASMKLERCTIADNEAAYGGGLSGKDLYAVFLNSVVFRNSADSGAAIYAIGDKTLWPVMINNSTIAANGKGTVDCMRSNDKGRFMCVNTIVWGNSGGVTGSSGATHLSSNYSLIQGYPGGADGNINGSIDPLFVDMAGGDFRLQALSPVIDQGSNALYWGTIPAALDLGGNSRLYADSLDLGAYEYPGVTTGIADPKQTGVAQVNAYPNPATSGDVITVSTTFTAAELNGARVQLLDISGRVVLRAAMTSPEMNLQVPDAAGIYTGRLLLSDGRSARFRVLIRE